MQIELDARLIEQLEAIARQQGRTVDDVVRQAIETYIKLADGVKFDQLIDQLMEDHAWLLNELARR